MFTQRATAHKLRIKDLLNGEYVTREGEPDYVLINEKSVMRARIIATIVNKYVNDERKSGSLTLDDASEVITARVWENDYHLIDKLVIGELIEVIGRIRKYNDEVYLIPEIIKKSTPDTLVLRKLELGQESVNDQAEEKNENTELKDKLFELIQSKGTEGASMDELVTIAGDKKECTNALIKLIEDDMIFEPRAGKYKAL